MIGPMNFNQQKARRDGGRAGGNFRWSRAYLPIA